MGNGASAEEKEKMEELNRQKIADEQRRQNERAAQEKRRVDDSVQREIAAERARKEQEVKEAAKRHLAEVDAKIAELAGIKDKQEEALLEWRKQAREAQNQVNAKLTAEAEAEQEKRRKVHEQEAEKLKKEMEKLEEARKKHLQTVAEGGERRQKIQLEHNEKTDKQTKDHRDYIVTANNNLKAYITEQQKKIKKVLMDGRAQMDALQDREERFKQGKMITGNAILQALDSSGEHDEFRENCNQLRNKFRILREAFNPIERALTAASSEMRRKKPLSAFPPIGIVLDAFESFNSYVEVFQLPDRFKNKLEQPFKSVKKGIADLKEAIEAMNEAMKDYDDTQKEDPKNVEKLAEYYNFMKENFDLVKKTLSDLVNEMREFDIPMSNEVTETIIQQTKALSGPGQWKIEHKSSGNKESTD